MRGLLREFLPNHDQVRQADQIRPAPDSSQPLIISVVSRPKVSQGESLLRSVQPTVQPAQGPQAPSQVPQGISQVPQALMPVLMPTLTVPTTTVAIRPIMLETPAHGSQSEPTPVSSGQVLNSSSCPVFLGAQSAAILRAENAKPQRFSGLARDFRAFERDLEVYFERWTSVQPGALTDRMKIDILEEVLDQATSKMLHEWRSQDPAIDFTTVWKKVRRMFGDAVSGGARQEWRSLRFDYSGKPSTSVVSWRNFCADFTRLRKEVHDASEGEAIEFIRERLPHGLLREIDKEETNRRKRDGNVVKISGLMPIPEATVNTFLTGEGVHGVEYVRIRQNCHEAVMTDLAEAESLVTKLNGMVVNLSGTTMTITATLLGIGLTSTEIMDFLTDHLAAAARIDEEAKRGFQSREPNFSDRSRSRHSNRPNHSRDDRQEFFDIEAVSMASDPSDPSPHPQPSPPNLVSPRGGKGGKGFQNRRSRSKSPGKGRPSPNRSAPPPNPSSSNQHQGSEAPKSNASWMEGVTCYHCGERGHYRSDCPKYEGAVPQQEATQGGRGRPPSSHPQENQAAQKMTKQPTEARGGPGPARPPTNSQ